MKYPYGVGHIYSGKVVLYNPKLIPTAPKSFKDVVRSQARQQARHHRHPVSVHDGRRRRSRPAARCNDFEPGKELLIACKKAGARIYPTNEAFAQALKTEEIGIGIMWKARVVQWQNAGISVETVAPEEGVPMYVSGFVIPKNAPNKDGAYAYLDAMLEKSAQENFADRHGLQPDRHQRDGRARPEEAHRLHARGAEAPGRSRLRLSSPRTTPRSRSGGTRSFKAELIGGMPIAATRQHGPVASERRGDAPGGRGARSAPATIFVGARPAGCRSRSCCATASTSSCPARSWSRR